MLPEDMRADLRVGASRAGGTCERPGEQRSYSRRSIILSGRMRTERTRAPLNVAAHQGDERGGDGSCAQAARDQIVQVFSL